MNFDYPGFIARVRARALADLHGSFAPVLEMRAVVASAARRLDAVAPGWRARIDRDSLNLHSVCDCVLGQLFGSYERGLAVVYDLRAPLTPGVVLGLPDRYAFTGVAARELWFEELDRVTATTGHGDDEDEDEDEDDTERPLIVHPGDDPDHRYPPFDRLVDGAPRRRASRTLGFLGRDGDAGRDDHEPETPARREEQRRAERTREEHEWADDVRDDREAAVHELVPA